MTKYICAFCGLTFRDSHQIPKRRRHLEYDHNIVNVPSQIWLAKSKRVFVNIGEASEE